eukprot:COSAG01_NODE_485_length_16397_cov_48.193827_4_plen_77_part_00
MNPGGEWRRGVCHGRRADVRCGPGPKPKRGKSVKCRYLLRLTNDRGRIVDKSPPSGFSFRAPLPVMDVDEFVIVTD